MKFWRRDPAFVAGSAKATLERMDRVRFGRALGFGTKQAIKTLTAAVNAATAANPSAKYGARNASQSDARSGNAIYPAAQALDANAGARADAAQSAGAAGAARMATAKTAQAVVQARQAQKGLGSGTRRFGEAVWRPFVRLSGVLWLEVSGVFFGVFALLALGYIWRFHAEWRPSAANAAAHRSLMGAVIMLVLFGYFCVSSFVRARRRERGR